MSWANYVKARIRKQFSSPKLVAMMERINLRNNLTYEEVYEYTHDLELSLTTAKCHITYLLGLCEQYRDITFEDGNNGKNIKEEALLFIQKIKL